MNGVCTAVISPRKDVDQIDASRRVLEESARETEHYDVVVAGQRFTVLPGVFSPKYFGSTHVFAPLLPIVPGDVFLEIGCGTGILSVIAAERGAARVVAIDISHAAVRNTIENAKLHRVEDRVEAREGDIYSCLREGEQFDAIFWNMPFIFIEEDYQYRSVLERALFDPGYQLTQRFISEGRRFLKPHGRLLVGWGDFGDIPALFALVKTHGYSIREIGRGPGREGGDVTFILYELRHP